MISRIKGLFKLEFIRFLLVGGINTLFGYGVYTVFIFAGLNHRIAILLATILGVIFNFKTIGKLVFRHDNADIAVILKFLLVYTISYLLNSNGVTLVLKILDNSYLAGLIVIVPVSVLTYFLNRIFVFQRVKES